jgi:hypothetical protein
MSRAGGRVVTAPPAHESVPMWILFARRPKPDARYWAGRRWFATLDALVWPAVLIALVVQAPYPTGMFGQVLVALAAIEAVRRRHLALWRNERYWFGLRALGNTCCGTPHGGGSTEDVRIEGIEHPG